jgi:hypothetical protein
MVGGLDCMLNEDDLWADLTVNWTAEPTAYWTAQWMVEKWECKTGKLWVLRTVVTKE